MTAIQFYGGFLSNFAHSPITMKHPHTGRDVEYTTVEHWFAANKARTTVEHERIRMAGTPGYAKALGRKTPLREDWEDVKYEVMLQGLRAKFALPGFRERLLETGDAPIEEDSPTDFEWGARNGGKNLLGKALMQVRAELRAADAELRAEDWEATARAESDGLMHWRERALKMRQAVVDTVNILGAPRYCSCNACEGCQYEMYEAVISGLETLGYLTITHTKTGEKLNAAGGTCLIYDTKYDPEDPLDAWAEFMRVELGVELREGWKDRV